MKSTDYEYRYVSLDQKILLSVVNDHRDILDKQGVPYKGPFPCPRLIVSKFPVEIEEELPSWLLDDFSTEELELLRDIARTYETKKQLCIFVRRLLVKDDRAVRKLAEQSFPDIVRISLTSEETTFPTGRNVPYTYNPNQEHTTDVDFDAHN